MSELPTLRFCLLSSSLFLLTVERGVPPLTGGALQQADRHGKRGGSFKSHFGNDSGFSPGQVSPGQLGAAAPFYSSFGLDK